MASSLFGLYLLSHHSAEYYSEKTSVCGVGKNPSTFGLGIFAPHLEPCGELIAQYRPPMSFCFYPTFYLGNHLYFQRLTVLETSKEYPNLGDRQRPFLTCRYGDATTFTCDVIMVPVVTREPNITNILCCKIAPKPLQESFWITMHLYPVKQFKIESSAIFSILEHFQNFDIIFYESVPHCLSFYNCVSASPII